MIDPVTQLSFSIVENPGTYALLLGSGVSRSAQIPTGWEIILDLARRLAIAEGVEGETDWAAWYRGRLGTEPSYSALLDALSLTASDRRSILHNYIEPSPEDLEQGRRVPTRAHRAIAKLIRDGFIKVVITTNFDRLLESALRELGVEPTVIKSVDDLAGASPIVHSRCYILKLHGDYLDTRILNTDQELAGYPPEYNHLLDRIADEYGLIVSGWSGEWDPALRAAILRAPNRRFSTYWAARGKPGALASDVIAQRAARLVEISDSDSFFEKVQQSVETLHRSRRVNPAGIELLLGSTKRFLARPEYRIELGDLINEELDRLQQRLASDDFPVQMSVTAEILNARWDALEALAEPLARALGLAGRWGDGSDYDLANDCLLALTRQPTLSGSTALLGLRRYPAYLCFLTYALGLTKAGRWAELLRWLQTDIAAPWHSPSPAVTSLFMSFWTDVEPDWWKGRHEAYSNRKTPWADYLVDHIVPWSRDYGLAPPQALENYHMTELLGGFAALTEYSEDGLHELSQFTWMPHGQLMWSSENRSATLKRLEAPNMQASLFAAGFSNGSARHWDGVKKNIGFLAQRMRW